MRHLTPQKPQSTAKNPLKPCVTLEEMCAFEPDRPETFTKSPLMNQILAAMCVVCPISTTTLGKYLDVDPKKLLGALELLTGMPYPEMREKWAKGRLKRLKAEHPDWTQNQLAQAVGFADNSGIWRMEHRYKRKQEYRELKAYLNRPQEQKDREWEEFVRKHNLGKK